jgi:hypothetical protein
MCNPKLEVKKFCDEELAKSLRGDVDFDESDTPLSPEVPKEKRKFPG